MILTAEAAYTFQVDESVARSDATTPARPSPVDKGGSGAEPMDIEPST